MFKHVIICKKYPSNQSSFLFSPIYKHVFPAVLTIVAQTS